MNNNRSSWKTWLTLGIGLALILGVLGLSILIGPGSPFRTSTVVPADQLVHAVLSGDVDAVTRLLARQPNRDLEAPNVTGMSLLMLGVEAKSPDVIRVLLDSGADPSRRSFSRFALDMKDHLPLAIAVMIDDTETVRVFVEHDSSAQYTEDHLTEARNFLQYVQDKSTRTEIAELLNSLHQ